MSTPVSTTTSETTAAAYWDRHAKRYDRSLRLLGRAFPRMLALLEQDVTPTDRVLEVAAGTGLVTAFLARHAAHVVATDYSKSMIAELRQRVTQEGLTNVECSLRDVYDLGFEPASFDVVVAANVLHLVPDLERALSAMAAVLKPGGKLIVPTFCHRETIVARIISGVLALTRFPGKRRFTANELRQAVESAGLELVRHESISGLIPIGYVSGRKPATRT